MNLNLFHSLSRTSNYLVLQKRCSLYIFIIYSSPSKTVSTPQSLHTKRNLSFNWTGRLYKFFSKSKAGHLGYCFHSRFKLHLLFPFFLSFPRITLIISKARIIIPIINAIKKNLKIKIYTIIGIFTNSFPYVPVSCRIYKSGQLSLVVNHIKISTYS